MFDGCDMIVVSVYKIYGLKGIGVLWVCDGVKFDLLMYGGG